MSSASSLLPSHHDQFRTKEYWETFFRERGGEKFEWYGSYKNELDANILRKIQPSQSILVVGCGNSELSAELYDDGFKQITNVDFSPLVIQEMTSKHVVARPTMQWVVGDMTAMDGFGNETFDVVLDKGALDALMSENTPEVTLKAIAMLDEITRVLSSKGVYLCITLMESYICQTLLAYFSHPDREGVWSIAIEVVQNNNRPQPSPFKTFFVAISKKQPNMQHATKLQQQQVLSLSVDAYGNDIEEPRLLPPVPEGVQEIARIQQYHQKQYEIGDMRMGRFERIDFWDPLSASPDIPRFSVIVLDTVGPATGPTTAAGAGADLHRIGILRWYAVFFVPSGREAEYQFSTQDGLIGIAAQAQCRRLLVVRCNRPHRFPLMTSPLLQQELSPIAMSLRPRDMPADEPIPYMALDADGDWETIARGVSTLSGEYIIEEQEAEAPEGGGGGSNHHHQQQQPPIYRRLIFLQNQNFIQTEVRLVCKGKGDGKDKKGKNSKKTNTKSGGKKDRGSDKDKDKDREGDDDEEWDLDYTYLDDHHRALLAALVLNPDLLQRGRKVVHPTNHKANNNNNNNNGASAGAGPSPGPSALVVGLGGGALPMCLQRYLPALRLWVCDLDPEMMDVARRHFAYRNNTRTHTIAAEGMALIEALGAAANITTPTSPGTLPPPPSSSTTDTPPPSSSSPLPMDLSLSPILSDVPLDLLCIDADSKDPSLGLSAPPQAFITPLALAKMHALLRPGGLLVLNVVARTASLLDELVALVQRVFGDCDKATSDTVNNTGSSSGSGSGDSKNSSHNGTSTSSSSSNNSSSSQVYLLRASEEAVNVTLLARKASSSVQQPPPQQQQQQLHHVRLLSAWLAEVNLAHDPLRLEELLPKLLQLVPPK